MVKLGLTWLVYSSIDYPSSYTSTLVLLQTSTQPSLLCQFFHIPPSSIATEFHLPFATNPSNHSTTTCPQLNTTTCTPPTRVVTLSRNNIHTPKKILDYLTHVESFIPRTFKQANQYPKWRAAMKAGFDALLKNQTW